MLVLQMTAARRSVGRQYIFITPNAIDGKNGFDKDVKIIRYALSRLRHAVQNTNSRLLDSPILARKG